ncbi:hypothetical protein TcasGA2_TC034690 [Tribolium castaneum]|uniref:Uncharacterized protein n=1 Tax=Tribolium castaneum TaxID=7070 RepID=A0A139WI92_TRICA|nr:hypothetical protein TcasGA2_TC034690 [Tribolium castaneum]
MFLLTSYVTVCLLLFCACFDNPYFLCFRVCFYFLYFNFGFYVTPYGLFLLRSLHLEYPYLLDGVSSPEERLRWNGTSWHGVKEGNEPWKCRPFSGFLQGTYSAPDAHLVKDPPSVHRKHLCP